MDGASDAYDGIPLALVELGYNDFDLAPHGPLLYLTAGYLELLGHSKERAQAMVTEYVITQPPTDDWESHEGPAGMAIYIHYVIAERGNTDEWMHFVDWRKDFQKSDQYAKWRQILWPKP